MDKYIKSFLRSIILKLFPELNNLLNFSPDIQNLISVNFGNQIGERVKLDKPYRLYNVTIGDYTYIAVNSRVSLTSIGKFCSIGPYFLCGWGIHPVNGISTSPTFYSSTAYNGFSLSTTDKIEERKQIKIGNDVFIGANVTILDGVIISDGAIVAAGATVTKNVPPYAIVAGVPAKIIKYRFEEDVIQELLNIKWWDWEQEKLKLVEQYFYDVRGLIRLFKN